MATTDVALREASGRSGQKHVVNDLSIQVATVNGSGSQSSNTVLLRSIFQMGIPVSGKNLFPSNIAGLPTWYTIRANKDGYIARKKEIDFLVAMNPETAQEDVKSLAAGAVVVYDEPLNLRALRDDLIFYAVPYDKLVAPVCPEAKLRKLVRNMIYVGVVAKLLGIEMAEVEKAIRKQFAKKVKAANLNLAAVEAGFHHATATLPKQDPYFVERSDQTAGKIIIDGNSAAALGSMFAGVTVVTWYPITPSSSLVETLIDYMKRSEEHTSELQSRVDLVCRLLLEKKKNKISTETTPIMYNKEYALRDNMLLNVKHRKVFICQSGVRLPYHI